MKRIRYEKPAMKFVNLRNEKSVANTCWGHHSSQKRLYYDSPGTGWMSFQIQKGSCTLSLINITYHANNSSSSAPTSDQVNQLDKALRESGGESGNPYKGEGTVVFEDPGSNWS